MECTNNFPDQAKIKVKEAKFEINVTLELVTKQMFFLTSMICPMAFALIYSLFENKHIQNKDEESVIKTKKKKTYDKNH